MSKPNNSILEQRICMRLHDSHVCMLVTVQAACRRLIVVTRLLLKLLQEHAHSYCLLTERQTK